MEQAACCHLGFARAGEGQVRPEVIEVEILTEGGIPAMSAHLFSNHYNKTRSRYYELLHEVSLMLSLAIAILPFAARTKWHGPSGLRWLAIRGAMSC